MYDKKTDTKNKPPKKKKYVLDEDEQEFNARVDHLIIEALKTTDKGLCIKQLDTKLKKDLAIDPKINLRTRIGTRIRYLMAFGKQTGLFEIRCRLDDDYESDTKKTGKKNYYYTAKISNAEMQLMLRSFRAIKGKPVDKWENRNARDEKTGLYKVIKNPRRFFADYATEGFISSFDGEDPPEIRNQNMIKNISTIISALKNKNKLKLKYGDYNINGELCPRKDKDGNDTFIIYPIKMTVSLCRYYLYCEYQDPPQKTDEDKRILYSLRVDRIISCTELNEKYEIDPEVQRVFAGTGEPHFAQRLYMFTGRSSPITILTDEKHLNDVFDWFGNGIHPRKQKDGTIEVTVWADPNAMLYWALQYCRYVKVTSPPELVERIKKTLEEASEKYGNNTTEDQF